MIQAGSRLGDRYVLDVMVGRGQHGEVWRVEDTMVDRFVAVKLMPASLPDDPDFMRRLRPMAQAIAMLGGPNIVELYDFRQTSSTFYLVTQFVEGESLHTLLGRVGALAPSPAMNLIAQAARALHVAHSGGIVHGDLKTTDLLVRPDGRLLVSDFGIARVVSGELPEQVVGDSQYISPAEVDERRVWATPLTDIYALGVVAYVCLTLTQPFPGDNPKPFALMDHQRDPPPLPADIPQAAQRVVMRALAPDPRSRWSSAKEMSEAAAAASLGHPN